MTIYSQHAHRGKVQILATYRGLTSTVSSTVTSVESSALAIPIVSALNRISFCAAVPVNIWDKRARRFVNYPLDHVTALTVPSVRPRLLEGAHSLWYEHAMVLLHHALSDLGTAVTDMPAPVKKAIDAELEAEARGLREGYAEYLDGVLPSDTDSRRVWDLDVPMVTSVDSDSKIHEHDPESMNDLERDLTEAQLERTVADLRLLMGAYLKCANAEARLVISGLEITDDPYDEDGDRYFLNIQAPMPNGKWERSSWIIEICRWVPDDEDHDRSTGREVLDCVRTEPPSSSELVELLNRSSGSSEVLSTWARTAVGGVLAGTSFTVTKRYDD